MICTVYDLLDCTTPTPEPYALLDAMRTAVARLGATILGELPVLFQPHGITCVVVLAESQGHVKITACAELITLSGKLWNTAAPECPAQSTLY